MLKIIAIISCGSFLVFPFTFLSNLMEGSSNLIALFFCGNIIFLLHFYICYISPNCIDHSMFNWPGIHSHGLLRLLILYTLEILDINSR